MNELLPCPFCGGEAEFVRLGDKRVSCQVKCTNCGASHESSDEGEHNGSSWNMRDEAFITRASINCMRYVQYADNESRKLKCSLFPYIDGWDPFAQCIRKALRLTNN